LTLHLSEWEGRSAYQLRGMATEEVVRGTGVGKTLLEAAEKFVRGTEVRRLWCNARVPAMGFYEKAGWRVVSEEFEIPTAGPHVRMVREVVVVRNAECGKGRAGGVETAGGSGGEVLGTE
jgi:predicted GNAT family N-acyltransferase